MPSYYYKKKMTVTSTQSAIELPALRNISIVNVGNTDCQFEFDGDVTADSLEAKVNMPLNWNFNPLTLKAKTASGTTTLYVTGVRHVKA